VKLGLGTVQFGCNYGISNKKGQVPYEEIKKILDYAQNVGIDTLDTASLYGDSEKVLGQFNLKNFKVVTKTIKIDKSLSEIENLNKFRNAFYNSRNNLGCDCLYGLMFHESTDLLGPNGNDLWNLVYDFKNKGYVKKIGVSVYTPEVLIDIIKQYKIDIVQMPLNILDQRFVFLLKELKSNNIEIHTRSTFLQGLLLMADCDINPYFDEIRPLLNQIPNPKLDYALQFVNNIKDVDKIIVGTTCLQDLKEIVEAISSIIKNIDFEKFKVTDERLILPQNWRLK
jgi:aryl-alcohol dehydrogenase-like predicted oxidoreductase